jgi:hypothetical protein
MVYNEPPPRPRPQGDYIMIRNLIGKAFWNSYEKRITAEQEEYQKTQAILEKTAYLSSNPDSVFHGKKF